MEFADFLTAFGNGYKAKWRKEDFCKVLLCSIAKDDSMVIYENGNSNNEYERGTTTFQSYYRNTKRRSIRPIAVGIHNDIDRDKFKGFLDDHVKYCNKSELCKNFKEFSSDITEENLFDKITEIFVEILKAARNEPDSRCRPPISPHIDDALHRDNKVPLDDNLTSKDIESLIKEIDKTIKDLISTGRMLAASKILGASDNTIYSKGNNRLEKELEHLFLLCRNLSSYNSANNSLIIKQIVKSILLIKADNFILTENDLILPSSKNEHINRLLELLQIFKTKLNIPD